eukprot:TRINITY_DN33596_c0_g1_i1.p1 TRINITY_DN33596_c0_g1~~TRINITY_DN33596_c0_g1_i1.p1  ORF type:complete len:451 (+),score=65.39 TRINITY_DN33596_c0_g1_i1:100-1452(+)
MAHGNLLLGGISASKLQYHASKFSTSSAPGRVLRRYLSKAESMDRAALDRHISHVCAWVALAIPPTQAAEMYSTDKGFLSPVGLLTKMLRVRDHSPMNEQVSLALDAASSTCEAVLLAEPASYKHRKHWICLWEQLPKRQRTMCESTLNSNGKIHQESHAEDKDGSDGFMLKRLKSLNLSVCKWESSDLAEQERALGHLETCLADIERSEGSDLNTVALRKLLYVAIGALGHPQLGQSTRGGADMLDHERRRSQQTASFQRRIRRLLIRGIVLWRMSWSLEDLQIIPILARVRMYCDQLGEHHAFDAQKVCAAKQWCKLKLVSGIAATDLQVARQSARHITQGVAGRRSTSGGVYVPNEKIQALPFIRRADELVALKCTKCAKTITSQWFFTAAGVDHNQEVVIVPRNGHVKCGGKYRRADGLQTKNDVFDDLDVCSHHKVRKWCFRCGG